MNKDVENFHSKELESFAITGYLAALSGRLESLADGLNNYPSNGNEFYVERIDKMSKSLEEVRNFLYNKRTSYINLNK